MLIINMIKIVLERLLFNEFLPFTSSCDLDLINILSVGVGFCGVLFRPDRMVGS